MADDHLFEIASSVADGSDVDWDRAERDAEDEATRERIRALRAIAEIGSVHRSLSGDLAPVSDRTTLDSSTAPPMPGEETSANPRKSGPRTGEPRTEDLRTDHPRTWHGLEIRGTLGRGAFGTVLRAYDPTLDRDVALKLLRPESPARAEAAVREGRLLARVKHPNVVTVYGAEHGDGDVGIWMELIQGRDLATIVERQGPFGAREATLIGIDLCRALAAVHFADIAHRDVKAQNVMREDGGRIVLTDFGVGRDLGSLVDRDDALSGTPLYLAPELFEGQRGGVHADIYSLGVLLYYLASGDFPIHGRSITALRRAHKERKHVLLRDRRPDIPSAFAGCIERALEPDPDDRYPTAGAFASALERALQAQTTGVHTVDGLIEDRGESPNGRSGHPAFRAAWALSALFAIGLTAWLWLIPYHWPPHLEAPNDLLIAVDPTAQPRIGALGSLRKTLESALDQEKDLAVVSDEDIRDAQKRMRLTVPSPLTLPTVQEICKRDGVELVLWITARQAPSPSLADCVLLTCSGAHLAATSIDISNRKWSRSVRGTVRLISKTARRARLDPLERLPKVTTDKPRALEQFNAAKVAYGHGDLDSAISRLRQATKLDPQFSSAWAELGTRLHGAQRFQEASIAITEALATSGDVADPERYLVQASAARHFRQDERAELILSEAMSIAPSSEHARLLSMTRYRLLYPPTNIIKAAREAVALDPSSAIGEGWLIMMLAIFGNIEGAEKQLEEARSKQGDFAYGHWCEGVIHLLRGEIDAALAAFARMAKTDPLYTSLANLMAARAHALGGDLDVAKRLLRKGIALARNRTYFDNVIERRIYLAAIELEHGNDRAAIASLTPIESLPADPAFIFRFRRAAVLLARAGATEKARRMKRKLDEIRDCHPSSTSRSAAALAESAIVLAEGDRARAARILTQSTDERVDWESLRLGLEIQGKDPKKLRASERALHELLGYLLLDDFPLDRSLRKDLKLTWSTKS